MSIGDPNSGPHACTVSIKTEEFPPFLFFFIPSQASREGSLLTSPCLVSLLSQPFRWVWGLLDSTSLVVVQLLKGEHGNLWRASAFTTNPGENEIFALLECSDLKMPRLSSNTN